MKIHKSIPLLQQLLKLEQSLNYSSREISNLTEEFIKTVKGGYEYSNTSCTNTTCSSSNNGCENTSCTTGPWYEPSNKGCSNTACE